MRAARYELGPERGFQRGLPLWVRVVKKSKTFLLPHGPGNVFFSLDWGGVEQITDKFFVSKTFKNQFF